MLGRNASRFDRVRSGVKEALGWSLVTLASQPLASSAAANASSLLATQLLRVENNVIVAGFILDALARLAVRQEGDTGTNLTAAAEAALVASHGWRNEESLYRAMGGKWWSACGK